jgi:LPXTG-motif cell wall-anchored protein
MRANGFSRWIVGAVAVVAALAGGQVAASDYPPNDTTVTTVYEGGDPPDSSSTGDLPETGKNSGATMKFAGGALVAGVGMLAAARVRRRPSAG